MIKNNLKKFFRTLSINKEVACTINLENILRGAEGDTLTGLQYVQMTGNIFRTSTRVIDGPQVQLLKDYEKIGEKIFEIENFIKTSYYTNALESIYYLGDYFPSAKKPEDIIKIAKRFVDSYLEKNISHYPQVGHNKYEEKIILRKIIGSNCYQIISGNHRVASAFMKNKQTIKALVRENENTHTYFTDLISKVVWDEGTALYQPIKLPELSHLPLIRQSYDRLEKMITYLKDNNYSLKGKRVLDIGSYYGWFVNEFSKKGANTFGLERDFTACKIAVELNNLSESQFINKPLEDFILNDNKYQYDIILFLSVLHHFSLGKSFLSDVFVLNKLAEKTKNFMFFDTGEEHETMFGNSLRGWNEASIKKFVLQNSDFKEVITLGRDSDNVGKHINDYRRMLFVFKK